MPPRFYHTPLSAREVVLEGDELRHLRTVRRLAPGDAVELFDGRGRLAQCTLVGLDRRRAELAVESVADAPPPRVALTVATAVPKGQRMDTLVEKLTELGTAAVWPLATERASVTDTRAAKRDRWRRLTIEASKQCGRLYLPEVAEPMALPAALERLAREPADLALVADPSPEAARIADVLGEPGCTQRSRGAREAREPATAADGPCRIVGFIGPEGGFTDAELATLRDAGAVPVRLAADILRIETAAVALAAAVAARWA